MATADAAREIAASIINGDIAETTYTDEVVVQRVATDYLPLRNGPVTTVTSVTLGDDTSALTASADDGYSAETFGLRRTYPYNWPVGKITITYKTGWASGSEPTNVQEALTALESFVDTNPELRARSIRVGDEAVWFHDGAGEVTFVPTNVMWLLRKWVKRDVG